MTNTKKDRSFNVGDAKADKASYAALGKAFWRMARHYQLSRADQATLLGIKPYSQRLVKLEQENAIPEDPDKAFRVGQLLGIHKSLRILYPHNREVVYAWLRTRRDLFQGKSAIEYIGCEADSIGRLAEVRRLLDQIRCQL